MYTCIIKVARLGGYLALTNDPLPGNIVMWRGLSRLTDIVMGFEAAKDVSNRKSHRTATSSLQLQVNLLGLGGHPKPANDGHLKTGQR
jgi:hypothetical protein